MQYGVILAAVGLVDRRLAAALIILYIAQLIVKQLELRQMRAKFVQLFKEADQAQARRQRLSALKGGKDEKDA